ncbi:unnamed protein product [Pleuronectes platessa]|uniref:Uncharacterized protein n=1 Tax=Pleuronectes platessa TaxID=8262 RepID=A0A9N7U8E0_PLEPL|nr:unnamed protein product [Pleuronectes platessa]
MQMPQWVTLTTLLTVHIGRLQQERLHPFSRARGRRRQEEETGGGGWRRRGGGDRRRRQEEDRRSRNQRNQQHRYRLGSERSSALRHQQVKGKREPLRLLHPPLCQPAAQPNLPGFGVLRETWHICRQRRTEEDRGGGEDGGGGGGQRRTEEDRGGQRRTEEVGRRDDASMR